MCIIFIALFLVKGSARYVWLKCTNTANCTLGFLAIFRERWNGSVRFQSVLYDLSEQAIPSIGNVHQLYKYSQLISIFYEIRLTLS